MRNDINEDSRRDIRDWMTLSEFLKRHQPPEIHVSRSWISGKYHQNQLPMLRMIGPLYHVHKNDIVALQEQIKKLKAAAWVRRSEQGAIMGNSQTILSVLVEIRDVLQRLDAKWS